MSSGSGIVAQIEAQSALGAAAAGFIPGDAVAIVMEVSALTDASRFRFFSEASDGRDLESMRTGGFDLNLVADLRASMYQDGAGTWFSATIRVDRMGTLDATFDYDNEPQWRAPVDPIEYVRDQEKFPRDPDHQPEWLKGRLAEGYRRQGELESD